MSYPAPQLAALTLKKSVEKYSVNNVDMVIMGHARQAGCGPNTARQATIFAGLSETVPAFTINQACASGMSAVISAAEKISLGRAKNIMAGGVESMSNTPYLVPEARWGTRMGHKVLVDAMTKDGFHCPMADMVMGATVEEFIAKELNISRHDQDTFAVESQKKATAAWSSGRFAEEVFEVEPHGKNPGLKTDEHMRPESSMEGLSKLMPVFDPKAGSVTAGNSSGVTDGSAFLFVSEQNEGQWAELLDYEVIALDPKRMGLGPIQAINNLLKKQGLKASDIECFEINEAFAAQVIACQRELKLPPERINICGGAIAIGHPIGASGARIVVTLMHSLKGKKGALGIASLCVSGGMGAAVLIRSLK